jgi:hypothetical protein
MPTSAWLVALPDIPFGPIHFSDYRVYQALGQTAPVLHNRANH